MARTGNSITVDAIAPDEAVTVTIQCKTVTITPRTADYDYWVREPDENAPQHFVPRGNSYTFRCAGDFYFPGLGTASKVGTVAADSGSIIFDVVYA